MTQTALTGSGESGWQCGFEREPRCLEKHLSDLSLSCDTRRQARHLVFLAELRVKVTFRVLDPRGCINICWAHVWLHRGLGKPISLHASFLGSRHWDGMHQGWRVAEFTVIAQRAACMTLACMRDGSYKVWSHEQNPHMRLPYESCPSCHIG